MAQRFLIYLLLGKVYILMVKEHKYFFSMSQINALLLNSSSGKALTFYCLPGLPDLVSGRAQNNTSALAPWDLLECLHYTDEKNVRWCQAEQLKTQSNKSISPFKDKLVH